MDAPPRPTPARNPGALQWAAPVGGDEGTIWKVGNGNVFGDGSAARGGWLSAFPERLVKV